MSFIEIESWEITEGNEKGHHQKIREWFRFVKEHQPELFAEWKSARYYRQTDVNGHPTGRYLMAFEFHSVEARRAYKERRKDWSGAYAAYQQVAPDPHFKPGSEQAEYWEPHETNLWLEVA
jgi:hypothetical protein